ncbi:hypothetical protein V8G54_011721 [Vigna mungo]|uniref:Uncharacterized protein n=1 Tax=Vigna mungo TaxID=3915 RepID=A0AAQ3NRU4_VIGMU
MDKKKLLQLVGKANSNLADVILKVGLFERYFRPILGLEIYAYADGLRFCRRLNRTAILGGWKTADGRTVSGKGAVWRQSSRKSTRWSEVVGVVKWVCERGLRNVMRNVVRNLNLERISE